MAKKIIKAKMILRLSHYKKFQDLETRDDVQKFLFQDESGKVFFMMARDSDKPEIQKRTYDLALSMSEAIRCHQEIFISGFTLKGPVELDPSKSFEVRIENRGFAVVVPAPVLQAQTKTAKKYYLRKDTDQ